MLFLCLQMMRRLQLMVACAVLISSSSTTLVRDFLNSDCSIFLQAPLYRLPATRREAPHDHILQQKRADALAVRFPAATAERYQGYCHLIRKSGEPVKDGSVRRRRSMGAAEGLRRIGPIIKEAPSAPVAAVTFA